jgi:hypothetical protein
MTVIFAQPRHVYESYADLRSLIALSDFPLVYYDEIDPQSDNTYILTVLNGEVPEAGYPDAHARIILWDLEYHLDGVHVPGVELWAADKWYAEQIGAKYVPMGSHSELMLDRGADGEPHYDAAYLGYMIPRRQQMQVNLQQAGVKTSPPHAWGDARHNILYRSWTYVQCHQHENVPTIAPLRLVVAAAYKLPYITETVHDAGVFKSYITQYSYQDLAGGVRQDVSNAARVRLLREGDRLHQFLCHDFTFKRSVESAL